MNRFTFLKSYLNRHKTIILALFFFVFSFVVSFILFGVSIHVVIYPSILASVLILIVLLIDIEKKYQQFLALLKIKSDLEDTFLELPKTNDLEIKYYQQLIEKLLDEKREIIDKMNRRYEDSISYYTMWTHQIKTPISSMKLKLDDLESNYDAGLNADLSSIERYVEMALNYLKLKDSNLDYVFKHVLLDKCIKECIRDYSNDFILKKLKLEYEPIEKEVLTDEKWFCFVLKQILSNAIKYTDKGSISIFLDENERLVIEDTGIGIDSSDLVRAFEKGYSGFNGRRNKNASGIGLYLSKMILDKLNIEISIESKISYGTRVLLTFPKKEY